MIDVSRLAAALFYWFVVTTAAVFITIDSRRRMKRIHVLTFAFGSFSLGSTSLIIRLFVPRSWELGLALSIMTYATGVLLIWTHFELMTKERPSYWMVISSTSLMTLLVIGLIGSTNLTLPHDSTMLFFSFTGLLILALFALPQPLFFAMHEYITYRQRQSFLEALGYIFLLLAAINFYFDFIWNRFNSIYNTITIFLGSFGVLLVIIAYLLNRAYLYRLPIDIQHVFCFHDSGINFYNRTLLHPHVENKDDRITFLTGILGATEAIFKKVLHQQLHEILITGDVQQLYFARDPIRKIGVGVISQSITWYLKQSVKRLLETIPSSFITEKDDPSTMKVVDHSILEEIITPLVQMAFPYFVVTMTSE